MKPIRQTYHIKADVKKVWDALVKPKIINAWGGGPSKMQAKKGGKFSFWGGEIIGKNLEVNAGKKIVQSWQVKNWKEPSTVTFLLTKEKGGTKVVLVHEDVPAKSYQSIKQGWKDYYLGNIKKYFGGDAGN